MKNVCRPRALLGLSWLRNGVWCGPARLKTWLLIGEWCAAVCEDSRPMARRLSNQSRGRSGRENCRHIQNGGCEGMTSKSHTTLVGRIVLHYCPLETPFFRSESCFRFLLLTNSKHEISDDSGSWPDYSLPALDIGR